MSHSKPSLLTIAIMSGVTGLLVSTTVKFIHQQNITDDALDYIATNDSCLRGDCEFTLQDRKVSPFSEPRDINGYVRTAFDVPMNDGAICNHVSISLEDTKTGKVTHMRPLPVNCR